MKNIIAYVTFFLCLLISGETFAQTMDTSGVVKPYKQVEDRFYHKNKRQISVEKGKEFAIENSKEFVNGRACRKTKLRYKGDEWLKGGHWSGVGIGYNGLISNLGHLSAPADANYLSLKSKSISIMINPIDFSIVSRKNWSLISGLGFEFNNFNFDRNITLISYNGQIEPDLQYVADGTVLRKTKLVTAYLNIPLLMEFKFGGHSGGFINFGVIGGWRMQSHTKIK